jgi:hypothetical protein
LILGIASLCILIEFNYAKLEGVDITKYKGNLSMMMNLSEEKEKEKGSLEMCKLSGLSKHKHITI